MKFTSQYFSLWCHPYCRGGRENIVKRKIMSSKVDSIYLGIKIAILQRHMAGKSHDGNNIRCHKNYVEYLEYLFILRALVWSDTVHNFILDTNWLVLTWTYTGCWAWQKGSPPPVLPTCVGNWETDEDEEHDEDDDEEEEDDEGPENMKSVRNQSS